MEAAVVTGKVRLAVAGAGAFGREHMRLLAASDEAELVGVADSDAAAAEDAAARFGAGAWAADADDLIERVRPDGLIVATPGATHVAIATAALGHGIPVLLEKPVAPTAAEASSLAEAEARSSGFVLPGHILRFSEPHRRLAEMAQSDAVGPILSITARRHRDETHAVRYADDPVLMTMIHDIDLAIWISGASAETVFALRRPANTARSETMVTATGARGCVWRLSTAWTFSADSCPPDRIEVIGERGSVELEVGGTIRAFGPRPVEIDIADVDPDQPLRAEDAHFVSCIRSGSRPSVVTLADAEAGLAVTDAALASLAGGGIVRA